VTYGARTKYDEPGRAPRYAARSPRRDAEEWALLARLIDALPSPPPWDALDAPSGTGRIAERLLARGIPTRCADLSPAMRRETAKRLTGRDGFLGVEALDLEAPTPPPGLRSDLVVCLRLFHHLPDAATRGRVLGSLATLTRRHLILSFHHPLSPHGLQRRLAALVRGRPSDRYTLTPAVLAREARTAGLELVASRALSRYRREFWLAHLQPDGRPR